MTTVPHATLRWRKAMRSTASDTCVELAFAGWVRDSKNPAGPVLRVDLRALMAAANGGQLDR